MFLQVVLLLPSSFFYGVVCPLHLAELDHSISSNAFLAIQDPDGMLEVGSIWLHLKTLYFDYLYGNTQTFL